MLKKITSAQLHMLRLLVMPVFTALIFGFAFLAFNDAFGWFASNDKADGNGISVTSQRMPNLVIAAEPDTITDMEYATDDDYSLFLPVADMPLHSVTRVGGALKVLSTFDNVDFSTGRATDPVYTAVTDGTGYYIDQTFYVGAVTRDLPYNSLDLALDPETTFFRWGNTDRAQADVAYFTFTSDPSEPYEALPVTVGAVLAQDSETLCFAHIPASPDQYAFSADVYWDDAYAGTLNLQDYDPELSDKRVEVLSTPGTLVKNQAHKVTLRCYFDGALTPSRDTRTYIRADSVSDLSVRPGVILSVD